MRRLWLILVPFMAALVLVAALSGHVDKGVSIVVYGCAGIFLIGLVEITIFIRWERRKEARAIKDRRYTGPPS